jgi:hypothetical protein
MSDWLMKHPTPWDFFASFETTAGRDLDWFFGPWWFGTGVLDQAVSNVTGAETGTAEVTIQDLGAIRAPTPVVGISSAGDTVSVVLPAGYWANGTDTVSVTLEAGAPIVQVIIDPDRIFADTAVDNNVWTAAAP